MFIAVVLIVSGIVVLARSADQFVAGAVRCAHLLRVSAVVIGAVVMGFGTSAPEALVSGVAAGRGDLDVGVGNIVGSNIANLTLVLGAAAVVTPVVIHWRVLRREAPLSVGGALLFAVLVRGGLDRAEGIVLLACLVVALGYVVAGSRHEVVEPEGEAAELIDPDADLGREVIRTVLGLVGTVGGAWVLVEGAIRIADELGLSGGFVGLTLVAAGTSLPELVTSVVAARQDQTDLIVGNLLGSNLFNSLAVGGITGVVGDGPLVDDRLATLAAPVMVGVAVATWGIMVRGSRVKRWEGVVILVAWVVLVPLMPR